MVTQTNNLQLLSEVKKPLVQKSNEYVAHVLTHQSFDLMCITTHYRGNIKTKSQHARRPSV